MSAARVLLLSAVAVLLFASCAEQSAPPATAASDDLVPVETPVTFTADFRTVTGGPVTVGRALRISYDPARLTTCRGELAGGVPAWSITMHYRIAGGDAQAILVAGHEPAPGTLAPPITLDRAGDLEMWFENTSAFGCQAWDSAFGHNYHLTIAPPADGEPRVQFAAAYEMRVSGALETGRVLTIDYDASRLTTCRATADGVAAWSIVAHARTNGGAVRDVVVASGASSGAAAQLELDEPGQLELWFENTDAHGCRAWDSALGQNYKLTVAQGAHAPGWMGDVVSVLARGTCAGLACDADRRAMSDSFLFDTWARERAAVTSLYFDVWKSGVTDFDNPALWRQLDVEVHFRFAPDRPFETRYVYFERRVDHNARYAFDLRTIDPFAAANVPAGASCPDAPLTMITATDPMVRADVELYFTVNGVALRQDDGRNFIGGFEDHLATWPSCIH